LTGRLFATIERTGGGGYLRAISRRLFRARSALASAPRLGAVAPCQACVRGINGGDPRAGRKPFMPQYTPAGLGLDRVAPRPYYDISWANVRTPRTLESCRACTGVQAIQNRTASIALHRSNRTAFIRSDIIANTSSIEAVGPPLLNCTARCADAPPGEGPAAKQTPPLVLLP
jgi:hypothetical protein